MKFLDYLLYILKDIALGLIFLITIILSLSTLVFVVGAFAYRWWFILLFIIDCVVIPILIALACYLSDKWDIYL